MLKLPPAPAGAHQVSCSHSGLLTLIDVVRHRGVHLSLDQLVRDNFLGDHEVSMAQLAKIARANGFRAAPARMQWDQLAGLGKALPAIVRLRSGGYMVIAEVRTSPQGDLVILRDPLAAPDAVLVLDEARLRAVWDGAVLLVKRQHKVSDAGQPFGMRWVVGQILRDSHLIRDILLGSLFISAFAVAPIIYWSLLFRIVLPRNSLDTLNLLVAGFVFVVVFDTILGAMRRHIILHIVSKADIRMGHHVFDRMLRLPIGFFENTSTGQVTSKLGEIGRIRGFLLNSVFGTLLDSICLIVFIPVLFFVSTPLSLLVLAGCAAILLANLAFMPELNRRHERLVRAERDQYSHLVETVHGMRTVKTLALDARQRTLWDLLVARTARERIAFGRVQNSMKTVMAPLESLLPITVLTVAAYMILGGDSPLDMSSLIAFALLTGRTMGPLLGIAKLVERYHEARGSIATIASVVNHPAEEGLSGTGVLTPLKGTIELIDVSFRYPGTVVPAIDGLNLLIPSGSTIGIVGRSGSGKTTVTRLLQGLQADYGGLIKFDGIDIRQFDLTHLRSSIGVVLQDSFLFRGTIRENIGIAKPSCTLEDIAAAARLAGAEEFIERLPRGFDTMIEEGAANLSGGQRQRIAIARALLTNPRILILDEATSALDPESEAILSANLKRIAFGRTVVIISHRLASLVSSDAILVLERGRPAALGRHQELLADCRLYRDLWTQQNGHLGQQNGHFGQETSRGTGYVSISPPAA
jgi:ATP-binding cassette subfamily B protein